MIAEKLRKSILQAAIEGKLTDQLPEDGDARDLVEEIKKEKEELIKAGKIKKEKLLPEITEEEIPFDIPDNWCWVRLGDIGFWEAGSTPSRTNLKYYDGDIPGLKTGDLNNGYIEKTSESISSKALKENPLNVKPIGSVLIAMYGATIGKLGILSIEAATNQACCACVPYTGICNEYLFYYLMSRNSVFKKLGAGGAQPNISRTKIINELFTLPPLEEQIRIVDILKQVLYEISILEKLENEINIIDLQFESKLKNSILQAAMQGKLTEQLPEDGDAHDLLEEIQADKEKLIAEGKLKKQKPLSPITEEEIPFDIPDNWVWVRLGNVGKIQTGNTPKKTKPENYGDFIPFISPGDIKNGALDYHNNGLSEIGKNKGRLVNRNSILQVCIGGSMGKAAINQKCVSFNQQINSFTPYIGDVNYYYYILSSKFFIDTMKNKSTGTATPIINKTMWSSILIPLAPLSEQKEIVKKISGLEKFRS